MDIHEFLMEKGISLNSDTGKKYIIAKDGKPGPVTTQLYKRLLAIQKGEYPDTHGWLTTVE